jgi:MoaA/NifB/PqqE/SkfB family radical SAM enzyme
LTNTTQKHAKGIRVMYPEYGTGLNGLARGLAAKTMYTALPTIYKSNTLMKRHHSKLSVAYLELTNKCNLKCKMCTFQKMQEKIGYMPKAAFESYIDQLSDIGVNTLFLQLGGESLLHPEFKEFLNYAIQKRDRDQRIGMVLWTDNGMLFDKNIADTVVNLKVDSIYFSLDGIGQVNDNIRLGSNYSTIEKNIKYLLEKRGDAKKPSVEIYTVDYGKTEQEKMDLYRQWIHLVDQIVLIALIMPDNTVGNQTSFSNCIRTSPPAPFCKNPFTQMTISWDGKVSTCPMDYAFQMDLGDATKESLKEIWNGPKFQALRKATVLKTFPVGFPCYGCENWQISFKKKEEPILDGEAKIIYDNRYTKIQKASVS